MLTSETNHQRRPTRAQCLSQALCTCNSVDVLSWKLEKKVGITTKMAKYTREKTMRGQSETSASSLFRTQGFKAPRCKSWHFSSFLKLDISEKKKARGLQTCESPRQHITKWFLQFILHSALLGRCSQFKLTWVEKEKKNKNNKNFWKNQTK